MCLVSSGKCSIKGGFPLWYYHLTQLNLKRDHRTNAIGHGILINDLLNNNLPFIPSSAPSFLFVPIFYIWHVYIYIQLKVPRLIGHIKSQACSDYAVHSSVARFSKYFSGIIFCSIFFGGGASCAQVFYYPLYLPHLEVFVSGFLYTNVILWNRMFFSQFQQLPNFQIKSLTFSQALIMPNLTLHFFSRILKK